MNQAESAVSEGHAGHILTVGHLFSCFDVARLFHRLWQIGNDAVRSLPGKTAGQGIGLCGNVTLHRVGQGVHTGGGGQRFRKVGHHFRIIHRDGSHAVAVFHDHLDLLLLVRDQIGSGNFTCRAGSGVDGNDGRRRLTALIVALVSVQITAVCQQDPDCLGAVVRGAASQSDQEITAVFPICRNAALDIAQRGIGLYTGVGVIGNLLSFQFVCKHLTHGRGCQEVICNKQGLCQTHLFQFVAHFVQAACAEQAFPGKEETFRSHWYASVTSSDCILLSELPGCSHPVPRAFRLPARSDKSVPHPPHTGPGCKPDPDFFR